MNEVNIVNNEVARFNSSDISFFDLFYDGKSSDNILAIEHVDKNIFFRDVLIFIDRIKDVDRVKDIEIVRNNLHIYLRENTLE